MIKKQAHQGDVFIKASKLPENLTEIESMEGKTILALGEATGHHHRFESDNVKMFSANDNGKQRRFIVVSEKPATLFHEEHAPIEVAPGVYEIFIARQWSDDEEPIAVID